MKKYQYFSGRKQDFTFWSSNMTSQKKEHPQPKGQKESLDKLMLNGLKKSLLLFQV